MAEVPVIDHQIAHGESLDLAVTVAAAPAPPSPLDDGSVFTLALVSVRDNQEAVLRLSSATPMASPRIDRGAFAAPDITLTLRATDDRISQIPPGDYVGDLIQERPRVDATLGEQRLRLAVVTLEVIGGTGS